MAKKLYEEQYIQAIANAIRTKNGGTATYKTSEMANAILDISGGGDDTVDIIPSYVKSEARRVINAVVDAQNANTITFLAISDSHENFDYSPTMTSNAHAGLGAKVIAQAVDLDFATALGDYTHGSSTTTIEQGTAEIQSMMEHIHEAFSNIPNFRAIGNHDGLSYSYSKNGDFLKLSQLYDLIGKYNEGAVVNSSYPQNGYCYKDFDSKKLRVILLNTSESQDTYTDSGNYRISGPQMLWFAEAMDLSSKTNASDWSILVLSHCPLDWGGTALNTATKVIDAYVGGKNLSITHGGTTISKNYSGKNAAKFIANIHGHVHGYGKGKLHVINGSTATEINNTLRMATPNSGFTRTNEYGENGTADSNGLEFGDPQGTQTKVSGTAQDTAFVIYVIDTVAKTINAIHYGAGYDRLESYADESAVVYQITSSLGNSTSSNNNTTIAEGSAYTATLTAKSGHKIDSVIVTMGGTDITSSVYSNGTINIPSVTGNITITVATSAIPVNYTNLIPLSTTQDGTTIYNGTGFKNNTRLSEGSNATINQSSGSGYWASGIIEWDVSKPLYIKGWTWDSTEYCRLYSTAGGPSGTLSTVFGYVTGTNNKLTTNYTVTVLDADTQYVKLEAKNSAIISAGTIWFGISMPGTGDNVIITAGEPIDDNPVEPSATYTITNSLTNVATSNSATSITAGSNYTATLTPDYMHELSNVKVTMGGTDITSSVYSNGVINIPSVTGNVVITASSIAKESYSITEIFNAVAGSNDANSVIEGGSYTTTLSANSGYEITSVTVTMGGTDITSTAYSNGVINISNVTGDIVIKASASKIQVSYTNLLATAEDYSSTAVYNGVGYKDGKYLSTSATPYEGTDSAFFLTGYIPYVPSEKKPIYIKGAVWTEDSHSRFHFFDSTKKIVSNYITGGTSGNTAMSTFFTIETLDTNYIKLTPTSTNLANPQLVVYFRMSLKGKGSGVIITVDEPIE